MHYRTIAVLIVLLLIAALAALNLSTLMTPTVISLGFMTWEAPLALVLLGLCGVLVAILIAYIFYMQGGLLLETRRHTKEMQTQRELADKAEASRFTELRQYLEAEHQRTLAQIADVKTTVLSRMEQSDNATAAYVGELDDRMQRRVP